MRIWAREFKNNHMLRDVVIIREEEDTRTHKVFAALDEVCHELDLSRPVWLSNNISEFQLHKKTRFRQDSFIDEIEFDYLEFQILEE
ncbi:MAG: hypothetical protein K6G23_10580 [Lachnospiraceae bacterium]|nr:hypothetical protein [Lachnospiraceae bacterium]MCR5717282.1 hypothetical protein [Lachnospiraceae bacterium]